MLLMAIIFVVLSTQDIYALVPLIAILILLAAAAGASRGYSIFNLFGISTLTGIGSGRATVSGRSALGRYFFVAATIGKFDRGGLGKKIKTSYDKSKEAAKAGTEAEAAAIAAAGGAAVAGAAASGGGGGSGGKGTSAPVLPAGSIVSPTKQGAPFKMSIGVVKFASQRNISKTKKRRLGLGQATEYRNTTLQVGLGKAQIKWSREKTHGSSLKHTVQLGEGEYVGVRTSKDLTKPKKPSQKLSQYLMFMTFPVPYLGYRKLRRYQEAKKTKGQPYPQPIEEGLSTATSKAEKRSANMEHGRSRINTASNQLGAAEAAGASGRALRKETRNYKKEYKKGVSEIAGNRLMYNVEQARAARAAKAQSRVDSASQRLTEAKRQFDKDGDKAKFDQARKDFRKEFKAALKDEKGRDEKGRKAYVGRTAYHAAAGTLSQNKEKAAKHMEDAVLAGAGFKPKSTPRGDDIQTPLNANVKGDQGRPGSKPRSKGKDGEDREQAAEVGDARSKHETAEHDDEDHE